MISAATPDTAINITVLVAAKGLEFSGSCFKDWKVFSIGCR